MYMVEIGNLDRWGMPQPILRTTYGTKDTALGEYTHVLDEMANCGNRMSYSSGNERDASFFYVSTDGKLYASLSRPIVQSE